MTASGRGPGQSRLPISESADTETFFFFYILPSADNDELFVSNSAVACNKIFHGFRGIASTNGGENHRYHWMYKWDRTCSGSFMCRPRSTNYNVESQV